MTVIDKHGERQACDRCHRTRVQFTRLATVCMGCRGKAVRERQEARQFLAQAGALHGDLQAIRESALRGWRERRKQA
jgi:molybdenum cofactor biosynthesis enzyme MoaA